MAERPIPTPSKSRRRYPEEEGRAWVRYSCEAAIAFQPLESRKDGTWLPARVANLSAKGIGLVLDTPMQRGAILSVLLEGTGDRFSRPVLVRVVRATERPAGGWQLGCTFAIPLGEDELRALLPSGDRLAAAPPQPPRAPTSQRRGRPADTHDPFLQGSKDERRVFPRRRISVPVTISYGSAWEKSLEAQAIDTSLGGLRLLTRHPFGRGSILRVRSTKMPGRIPSVEVRVKSCTPQQTKWVVATQFLQQPPSEVLFYFS